jgi:hypothetical protein
MSEAGTVSIFPRGKTFRENYDRVDWSTEVYGDETLSGQHEFKYQQEGRKQVASCEHEDSETGNGGGS